MMFCERLAVRGLLYLHQRLLQIYLWFLLPAQLPDSQHRLIRQPRWLYLGQRLLTDETAFPLYES